jgi:hypothetical protein
MNIAAIAYAATGFLIVFTWAIILLNWRIGVWMLLAYATTSGLVVVAVYPLGLSSLALVSRDMLIVAPLYISLFVFGGRQPYYRVPWHVSAACGIFALMVIVGMANPDVPNLLVALIGAKVWLGYMPLLFVGAVFIKTERQLLSMLRLVLGVAWIAWILGLAQYVGALTIGFETTMTFMFGEYGKVATGNFTCFDFGAPFCRIPGSFQFNSQYGVFCLFMVFPLSMLLSLETSRIGRGLALLGFAVNIIAGFTSGARGNLILIPAAIMLIYFFRFRLKGGIQVVLGLIVAGGVVFNLIGIDADQAYGTVGNLGASYGQDIVVGGLADGIAVGGLLGRGTGTNTGAARYAYDSQAEMFADGGYSIENFMAKTMAELGVIGFVLLMCLFGLLTMHLLRGQFACRQIRFKDCAATITALVVFAVATSVKGWALDSEPLNFYFYLFVGFGFAIPFIDKESELVESHAAEGVEFPRAGGRYIPRYNGRARDSTPRYDGRNPHR